MKYYIVALFDSESYENFNQIQRNLSRKYRGQRHSPSPYIALEVLDNPNVDKLNTVIEKIIKPYRKFKVELSEDVSFSESLKTLNLKIEDKGYIKKISRSLSSMLTLHGFNVKDLSSSDELAISLANLNYLPKDSKRNNQELKCNFVNGPKGKLTLKVEKIELWKMSNNKKETPIKTYELKTF
ncbi:MAG: hypothetical protein ACRC7N_08875 [Clostridium sp.]